MSRTYEKGDDDYRALKLKHEALHQRYALLVDAYKKQSRDLEVYRDFLDKLDSIMRQHVGKTIETLLNIESEDSTPSRS